MGNLGNMQGLIKAAQNIGCIGWMALDNVTSHFPTMLEPITSASFLSSLSIIHGLIFRQQTFLWVQLFSPLNKPNISKNS